MCCVVCVQFDLFLAPVSHMAVQCLPVDLTDCPQHYHRLPSRQAQPPVISVFQWTLPTVPNIITDCPPDRPNLQLSVSSSEPYPLSPTLPQTALQTGPTSSYQCLPVNLTHCPQHYHRLPSRQAQPPVISVFQWTLPTVPNIITDCPPDRPNLQLSVSSSEPYPLSPTLSQTALQTGPTSSYQCLPVNLTHCPQHYHRLPSRQAQPPVISVFQWTLPTVPNIITDCPPDRPNLQLSVSSSEPYPLSPTLSQTALQTGPTSSYQCLPVNLTHCPQHYHRLPSRQAQPPVISVFQWTLPTVPNIITDCPPDRPNLQLSVSSSEPYPLSPTLPQTALQTGPTSSYQCLPVDLTHCC